MRSLCIRFWLWMNSTASVIWWNTFIESLTEIAASVLRLWSHSRRLSFMQSCIWMYRNVGLGTRHSSSSSDDIVMFSSSQLSESDTLLGILRGTNDLRAPWGSMLGSVVSPHSVGLEEFLNWINESLSSGRASLRPLLLLSALLGIVRLNESRPGFDSMGYCSENSLPQSVGSSESRDSVISLNKIWMQILFLYKGRCGFSVKF